MVPVDQNISKSGPSTPSNPPATPIPTLCIPSSQPQPILLTTGQSHHDHDPEPITDSNPNLNQELREATIVQVEHAPTANPALKRNEFIQQKLQEAKNEEAKNPWAKLSIYRVPKSLRKGDDNSYVPQIVSIGPLHHGKKTLSEMEPHKWRAVNRVLQRTGRDIDRYINAIRPLEERVRSCYEGHISMCSDDFLLSLVLDGIFVLELFVGATATKLNGFVDQLGYSPHDPVFAMRGVMHTVKRDMIMLENQIPLFVLVRLLATQLRLPDQPTLVEKMAVCFFEPLIDEPLHQRDRAPKEISVNGAFESHPDAGLHCLDVFRRNLLRTSAKPGPEPQRAVENRCQQFIHCVSELRKAGIRCRRRETNRFWDIKFDNNGTLQIPRILIHDATKSLFLNLIAFEQCHLDAQCHLDTSSITFTSYVIFMDNLINTAEDVRYLHDQGIIEHWFGNDQEVADLFSRLCQEVVFDFNNSYLSGLSDSVKKYYHSRWNTWSAILKRNHFSNPWAIISLGAAVFLLIFTFTQTFYSVYAYYRPQ